MVVESARSFMLAASTTNRMQATAKPVKIKSRVRSSGCGASSKARGDSQNHRKAVALEQDIINDQAAIEPGRLQCRLRSD
jgi:hypothetical protein